jgi:hypothetical protein
VKEILFALGKRTILSYLAGDNKDNKYYIFSLSLYISIPQKFGHLCAFFATS